MEVKKMERIIKKNIRAEIVAKTEKKEVKINNEGGKNDYWGKNGTWPPDDSLAMDTYLRGKSFHEIVEAMKKWFEKAGEETKLPYDHPNLRLVKMRTSGQALISGYRMETDDELEDRIDRLTDKIVVELKLKKSAKNRRKADLIKSKKAIEEALKIL